MSGDTQWLVIAIVAAVFFAVLLIDHDDDFWNIHK